MADIVYSLSPSASDENTDKILEFYREMTRGLNMAQQRIRVGMVPKDCGGDLSKLSFSSTSSKQNILNELDAFLASKIVRRRGNWASVTPELSFSLKSSTMLSWISQI